jgi:hypothetical protein
MDAGWQSRQFIRIADLLSFLNRLTVNGKLTVQLHITQDAHCFTVFYCEP